MSTRVELSEMETTRATKFLGWVLAGFLLLGGLWAYAQPLDRTDDGRSFDEGPVAPVASAEDRAAIDRYAGIRAELRRARRSAAARREDLELAREEFRTALEAGRPATALEQTYRGAQEALDEAEAKVGRAQRRADELAPAARAAQQRTRADLRRRTEAVRDRRESRERQTFGLRLAWVLLALGAAFWLFNRQRRAHSRYLVVGMAAIGFSAVQAFVMATDYTTDYIEVTDLGPLVLSLVGIALTLAALLALQRYLARRLPQRRVRRRECPFCGFPAAGAEHCEGCGRPLVGSCSVCNEPRRVGTLHCGACGSA